MLSLTYIGGQLRTDDLAGLSETVPNELKDISLSSLHSKPATAHLPNNPPRLCSPRRAAQPAIVIHDSPPTTRPDGIFIVIRIISVLLPSNLPAGVFPSTGPGSFRAKSRANWRTV